MMNNRVPHPQLDAWRLFLTLHSKIIDLIDQDIQQSGGIPLNQYDILIELHEADEKKLRLFELANRVVLSRSSITRLVDALEKKGRLRRETDPEDRRGSYAIITEEGEKALQEAWPLYQEAIMRHFGNFMSDEEAAVIFRVFERIISSGKHS